jgi:hypothetical protein
MTSTIAVRDKHRLIDDARAAIAVIIEQQTYVQYDDEDHRILGVHKGPSLLTQLDVAKRAGIERVGGHSPLRSLSPLCVAAWDLYQEISAEWRTPGLTLEHSFRSLPIDRADVATLHRLITGLRYIDSAIRTLLYPPRRLHLAVACPVCGERTVFVPDESGELVQHAALTVDGTVGCTCLACFTVWSPDRLQFLANVLGCQPL